MFVMCATVQVELAAFVVIVCVRLHWCLSSCYKYKALSFFTYLFHICVEVL